MLYFCHCLFTCSTFILHEQLLKQRGVCGLGYISNKLIQPPSKQIRNLTIFLNINMCKWMSILHTYWRNKHGKNFLSLWQQIKEKTRIYLAEIFPNIYFYFSIGYQHSFRNLIQSFHWINPRQKQRLSVCVSVVRTLEWWPGCSICTPSWSLMASCQIPVQW